MKPVHFIPPVISLAIAGGWVGSQQASVQRLERETVVLRERIDSAKSGSMDAGGQSLVARMKEDRGVAEGEIDWKVLGPKFAKGEDGGIANMRAMMEIQAALMEMSGAELLAELDKIEGLDLGKEVQRALDGVLVDMLIQKDPKAALDRYLDRVSDQEGGMSWRLSSAFRNWQTKDPVASLAWFDEEIGKGSFDSKTLDGRSDARLRFEGVAISGLLENDPAGAARRVEGIPEDQRLQLFQQSMVSPNKPESQKAFAELVRSSVSEEKRGEAYNSTISRLMNRGGFEKVDGFISTIGASSSERDQIVEKAARSKIQNLAWSEGIERGTVDEIREWAATQSPDEVDAITGRSLANVWGDKSPFQDRAKLIEDLHSEGASDQLIVSFLEENGSNSENREVARSLAERVADEMVREELFKRIGGNKE